LTRQIPTQSPLIPLFQISRNVGLLFVRGWKEGFRFGYLPYDGLTHRHRYDGLSRADGGRDGQLAARPEGLPGWDSYEFEKNGSAGADGGNPQEVNCKEELLLFRLAGEGRFFGIGQIHGPALVSVLHSIKGL
jgi:hypothetical protein